MFNVKFCTVFKDKTEKTDSISCPHYSIYKKNNGVVTITTYPAMLDLNGVERHLMKDALCDELQEGGEVVIPHYHFCYIENAAGKTVENVRP